MCIGAIMLCVLRDLRMQSVENIEVAVEAVSALHIIKV